MRVTSSLAAASCPRAAAPVRYHPARERRHRRDGSPLEGEHSNEINPGEQNHMFCEIELRKILQGKGILVMIMYEVHGSHQSI